MSPSQKRRSADICWTIQKVTFCCRKKRCFWHQSSCWMWLCLDDRDVGWVFSISVLITAADSDWMIFSCSAWRLSFAHLIFFLLKHAWDESGLQLMVMSAVHSSCFLKISCWSRCRWDDFRCKRCFLVGNSSWALVCVMTRRYRILISQ